LSIDLEECQSIDNQVDAAPDEEHQELTEENIEISFSSSANQGST
jgi:hypothetical protein